LVDFFLQLQNLIVRVSLLLLSLLILIAEFAEILMKASASCNQVLETTTVIKLHIGSVLKIEMKSQNIIYPLFKHNEISVSNNQVKLTIYLNCVSLRLICDAQSLKQFISDGHRVMQVLSRSLDLRLLLIH
jgi:hypothetical protein